MEDIFRKMALETPELIEKDYREFMEKIGVDNFFYFINSFGGTVIYIPRNKKIFSRCIKENVKNEFDGSNIKMLARKYYLSERTIRNYIHNYKKKEMEK